MAVKPIVVVGVVVKLQVLLQTKLVYDKNYNNDNHANDDYYNKRKED